MYIKSTTITWQIFGSDQHLCWFYILYCTLALIVYIWTIFPYACAVVGITIVYIMSISIAAWVVVRISVITTHIITCNCATTIPMSIPILTINTKPYVISIWLSLRICTSSSIFIICWRVLNIRVSFTWLNIACLLVTLI